MSDESQRYVVKCKVCSDVHDVRYSCRSSALPPPQPGAGTGARERELLIALTRAVDIFANVPAEDENEEAIWNREIMPALRAAQDFLLAPSVPVSAPASGLRARVLALLDRCEAGQGPNWRDSDTPDAAAYWVGVAEGEAKPSAGSVPAEEVRALAEELEASKGGDHIARRVRAGTAVRLRALLARYGGGR